MFNKKRVITKLANNRDINRVWTCALYYIAYTLGYEYDELQNKHNMKF